MTTEHSDISSFVLTCAGLGESSAVGPESDREALRECPTNLQGSMMEVMYLHGGDTEKPLSGEYRSVRIGPGSRSIVMISFYLAADPEQDER